MQRYALSVTPKTWEFGEWSEPRKFSVFERKDDLKLQKPEGFFQERNAENYQSRSMNSYETINQVVLK